MRSSEVLGTQIVTHAVSRLRCCPESVIRKLSRLSPLGVRRRTKLQPTPHRSFNFVFESISLTLIECDMLFGERCGPPPQLSLIWRTIKPRFSFLLSSLSCNHIRICVVFWMCLTSIITSPLMFESNHRNIGPVYTFDEQSNLLIDKKPTKIGAFLVRAFGPALCVRCGSLDCEKDYQDEF